MAKKLPIGIQGFEKLITDNFLYVDKTEYIYKLAHNNVPYFLSRPRRFGKSVLLSTLKAYWEGKSELFEGLSIAKLEKENPNAWKPYPVFYFDFNGVNYHETEIENVLDNMLRDYESIYGEEYNERPLAERFAKLIELSVRKTGRRAVVLVDEYDKPLLDTIIFSYYDEYLGVKGEEKRQLTNSLIGTQEHIRNVLKSFFGVLKKADENIQFVFITGVTKFHKVSIFSDLNNLKDISVNEEFASICGITDDEIQRYFSSELKELAKHQNMSEDTCLAQIKRTYDGYHFHPDGVGVYNPFSLMNAFADREFGSYWFESGTPTFLIHSLRDSGFDVRRFTDRTIYVSESAIKDYSGDSKAIIPLLYQSGYLTIVDYDRIKKRYTLGFPNEEVKYGFLESLIPAYIPESSSGNGLDIFTLDEYFETGNLEGIRNVFTALFANIAYTKENDPFENYFQAVVYLIMTLLGKFVKCEQHTFSGRIDCVIETRNFIYIMEFKRDDTAESALEQIEENEYALPFVADSRSVYKIGVSFDSKSRRLSDWKVL